METIEAILTRRSIRKYKDQPVSPQDVQVLLEAAMSAPSAGNAQPWQFVVITSRDTLDAIPSFHQYSRMLLQAPLAILVCGDLEREKFKGYWVQDCSAATQNILLAAHDLELGAVWLGIYPEKIRINGMRRLLNLPDTIMPLSLVSIGYPDQPWGRADRFDPARVHYDKW
ncbi:nitroreductase family protein [Desulfonatronovibrio hydrogenovorans]|uniref:nitroreductase family protein n=1 Tax=Desulfonatronovibrio hydrogenovorans TaxID=53245 RepID=UPI00048AFBD3|nr:nitroreductase family protein [Desulfonatronovibrio hydrogenovorans]